jgi:hypothetical protein
LDGIYALYAISRLAAIDAKAGMSNIDLWSIFLSTFSHNICIIVYADGSIVKEKLWTLIAQSEPSVISVQLVISVSF